MTFLAIVFWAAYLGTPVFVILWWVRLPRPASGKPLWPLAVALGLWGVQFLVWLFTVAACLGGHCRLSALQEYGPYALTALAYLAIGALLWILRAKAASSPGQPG